MQRREEEREGVAMVKSGKEAGGAERRKEPRYDRSLPVRVADDSPDGLKAESINISSRGLYCKVRRYVQPFSKLPTAASKRGPASRASTCNSYPCRWRRKARRPTAHSRPWRSWCAMAR